jgi:hypothetical protein
MPHIHFVLESPLTTQPPQFGRSLISCAGDGSQNATHGKELVGFFHSSALLKPCDQIKSGERVHTAGNPVVTTAGEARMCAPQSWRQATQPSGRLIVFSISAPRSMAFKGRRANDCLVCSARHQTIWNSHHPGSLALIDQSPLSPL